MGPFLLVQGQNPLISKMFTPDHRTISLLSYIAVTIFLLRDKILTPRGEDLTITCYGVDTYPGPVSALILSSSFNFGDAPFEE